MELIFSNSLKEFFNKYIKVDKNYNIRSTELMGNVYVLHPGLEQISFNQKIDWKYEHHTSANTYQLYLHTLNFTKNLVYKYIECEEEKFIVKARKDIMDWIETNSDNTDIGKYVWYDHTVANRLTNILFYQLNVPNQYKLSQNLFRNTVANHMKFLANDSNYAHNNHGIMMDRALILATIFIENDEIKTEYINIAKRRIENAILRDYSYMNIHLENSPDYHVMVTGWLSTIEEILREIKQPLNKKYQKKLKQALKFNGIISNYSNQFPMIGDTSAGRSKVQKSSEDFLDIEAGIAIFNDKQKKSTLVLNCGFQNQTHKHNDDLSIVFSINSEEIFIDSGKYNYLTSDPIRKHIVSPKAHSTIYIEKKSYPLISGNDMTITSFLITEEYKYVAAAHNLYDNVKIKRHILLIDGDVLIIFDELKSEHSNVYVQNYILNEKLKIERINNKYFIITSSKYNYKLREHSERGIGNTYFGQKYDAIISKKFNEILEVNRIEFKKKTQTTNFISSFSPENIDVTEAYVNNNNLEIKLKNKKYTVPLCRKMT